MQTFTLCIGGLVALAHATRRDPHSPHPTGPHRRALYRIDPAPCPTRPDHTSIRTTAPWRNEWRPRRHAHARRRQIALRLLRHQRPRLQGHRRQRARRLPLRLLRPGLRGRASLPLSHPAPHRARRVRLRQQSRPSSTSRCATPSFAVAAMATSTSPDQPVKISGPTVAASNSGALPI
jgi:hypothetical protein